MKLRTYQSDSVESAVRLAKIELGDEAIFVGSTTPEENNLGLYEVTFAVLDAGEESGEPARPAAPAKPRLRASPPPRSGRPLAQAAPGAPRRPAASPGRRPAPVEFPRLDARNPEHRRPHWKKFVPRDLSEEAQTDSPPPQRPGPPPLEARSRREDRPPPADGASVSHSVRSRPEPSRPESASPLTRAEFESALRAELKQLQRAIEAGFNRRPAKFRNEGGLFEHPFLARAHQHLLACELDAGLAGRLIEGLTEEARRRPAGELRRLLAEGLAKLCRTDSPGEVPASRLHAIAVVGPSGAGKTATVAKLAGQARKQNRAVRFIDAGKDQCLPDARPLEALAAAWEVPFKAAGEPELLAEELDRLAAAAAGDLVLIDTAALGAARPQTGKLAALLHEREWVEVLTVVSLTMRPADLSRAIERSRAFGPAALVFTHADETDALGSVLTQTARAGLPVRYLSYGSGHEKVLVPAQQGDIAQMLIENMN